MTTPLSSSHPERLRDSNHIWHKAQKFQILSTSAYKTFISLSYWLSGNRIPYFNKLFFDFSQRLNDSAVLPNFPLSLLCMEFDGKLDRWRFAAKIQKCARSETLFILIRQTVASWSDVHPWSWNECNCVFIIFMLNRAEACVRNNVDSTSIKGSGSCFYPNPIKICARKNRQMWFVLKRIPQKVHDPSTIVVNESEDCTLKRWTLCAASVIEIIGK